MYTIGVDEAGRGPWLGPVVAASLTFIDIKKIDRKFLSEINDSKKLSEKKRKEIFEELIRLANMDEPLVYFGVGVVDNFLIDEINIKKANREAMKRSLVELLRKLDKNENATVLIDGNDNYKFDEIGVKPTFIIGGDAKVIEIGAASIIAKVFRDELIKTYSILYPKLNLENHKGYGTKKHIDYLTDKSKITGIHRLSYKPVEKILNKKTKILLHVCCGPDASIPIIELKKDYEVICFWDNSNITDKKEYKKRFEAFKKVCEIEEVEYLENYYEPKEFLNKVKGYESCKEGQERCAICYEYRLKNTFAKAKELGIKLYTTTLTISPHKNLKKIFEIADLLNSKKDIEFLKMSFRKNDGFLKSIKYCEDNDIYRQDYCGCVYSKKVSI